MPNSRTRLKVTIPKQNNIHTGIVLYNDLQECYKSLDSNIKIIDKLNKQVLGQENKIERLNDKIFSLNEKIREKKTLASDEEDLLNDDFYKMWAMPTTRRTGSGTRRDKKRKMRRFVSRSKRPEKRKKRRTKRR